MKPFHIDSRALAALAHDALAFVLSWVGAFVLLRGDAGAAFTGVLPAGACAVKA